MGRNLGGGQAGGGMGRNVGAGAGGGATAGAVKSDHDVTLQLWGLIYIFERPDAEKLGIDEELAAQIALDDTDVVGQGDTADQEIARGGTPPGGGATPGNPPAN